MDSGIENNSSNVVPDEPASRSLLQDLSPTLETVSTIMDTARYLKSDLALTSIHATTANAEFHNFPNLPIELRLRIWIFAMPPPRIVDGIYYLAYKTSKTTDRASPTVPKLLHVCRESRNEMLTRDLVDDGRSTRTAYRLCESQKRGLKMGRKEDVQEWHECLHVFFHSFEERQPVQAPPTYISFTYDIPYLKLGCYSCKHPDSALTITGSD